MFEQKLRDQFEQKGRSELCNMTSCDMYVGFKQEFKLEKYLLCHNQNYVTSGRIIAESPKALEDIKARDSVISVVTVVLKTSFILCLNIKM